MEAEEEMSERDVMKKMHTDLVKKGVPPDIAAKTIQAKTGLSAVTGQPIQHRKTKVEYRGQYQ